MGRMNSTIHLQANVHCAMHDNHGHEYELCMQPKHGQIELLFKDSKKNTRLEHHGHWSYIGLLFYLRKVF